MARFCIDVDCPPCHAHQGGKVIDVPWEPVKRPVGRGGLVPALRAQARRLLTGPVKGSLDGLDGACGTRGAWVVSYRVPGSRRDEQVTVCARDARSAQVIARGRLGARIGSVRAVQQIAGLDGLGFHEDRHTSILRSELEAIENTVALAKRVLARPDWSPKDHFDAFRFYSRLLTQTAYARCSADAAGMRIDRVAGFDQADEIKSLLTARLSSGA